MPKVISKARKAKKKKAQFGQDLEIKRYSFGSKKHPKIKRLNDISSDLRESSKEAGINLDEKERSGSFYQMDHSVIFEGMKKQGLEVMNIKDALRKHKWLKDYYW